jgi:hypothetical protein
MNYILKFIVVCALHPIMMIPCFPECEKEHRVMRKKLMNCVLVDVILFVLALCVWFLVPKAARLEYEFVLLLAYAFTGTYAAATIFELHYETDEAFERAIVKR